MNNTRSEFDWLTNRKENKARKNMRRDDCKNEIERIVLEHLYMHRKAMTLRQIADALDRTPSRSESVV